MYQTFKNKVIMVEIGFWLIHNKNSVHNNGSFRKLDWETAIAILVFTRCILMTMRYCVAIILLCFSLN